MSPHAPFVVAFIAKSQEIPPHSQGAGPIEKHRVPMSPEPAKRSKKAAMALNSARWPCSCDWGRGLGKNHSIPSGKHTKNYGKSPFFMGKLTINGHFQ